MAEVQIVIDYVGGNTCALDLEPKIETFLTKWDVGSNFYLKNDTNIVVLGDLKNKDLSTRDWGDDYWILVLLSNTVQSPGFGLGQTGFSEEFYKELHQIVPDLYINFHATVIGYGNEYTDCQYSLCPEGWNVDWATIYAWDEDSQQYVEKDD